VEYETGDLTAHPFFYSAKSGQWVVNCQENLIHDHGVTFIEQPSSRFGTPRHFRKKDFKCAVPKKNGPFFSEGLWHPFSKPE